MEEDAKNIMDGEKDKSKCTIGDLNRRNATTDSDKKEGFFGHVMRSDGLEKGMTLACGEGRRRRGRPRRKWMDEIHEITGMKLAELRDRRKQWRRIAMMVTRVPGKHKVTSWVCSVC